MSQNCFGIYSFMDNKEKYIFNLTSFNFFLWFRIEEFIIASAKEVIERTKDDSIIDVELKYNNRDFYMIGTKTKQSSCFIFTTEPKPHEHLILLTKIIQFNGMKDTIEENFEYISTELKCRQIQNELDDIKYILVENIDSLLKRGEKMDDLVSRTQYLSNESKKFYDKTKKLNRCCVII
ncbi:synaptobrevin YKT6 [Tupanvirus soda lake]|uniref:Synaptobrevin YKT6 n=2 Tax=Tupanvirus TaxID=2094720 RepID=A0A6N1NXE3_9VIRU|nr:synaptobrevin YKT6 [Tupanvirus soda lake]QKU34862.1 synaptobrevin YKT6 [Tupanvirus soda lake]